MTPDEIAPSVPLQPWIKTRALGQPMAPLVSRAQLGRGEGEALSLAVERGVARLLIDERAARRIAAALGVPVIGTLGVLLAAKRRGHLGAIRPVVAALRDHGFWVADTLIEQVLAAADEL